MSTPYAARTPDQQARHARRTRANRVRYLAAGKCRCGRERDGDWWQCRPCKDADVERKERVRPDAPPHP